MRSVIPKIVWQTAPSLESLPPESVEGRLSWERLNTGWEIKFLDDSGIRQFFCDHLPVYLPLFDSLPLGVMKADFWRYAVIFVHGGVYADIDTECSIPISNWAPCEDANLVIACENHNPFFCQWVFSAPAGHPALLETLELIASRIELDDGVDTFRADFVHYYTGPGVWTDALQIYLGTQSDPGNVANNVDIWEGKFIRIYPSGYFSWEAVRHAWASFGWGKSGYVSWRDEMESLDAEPFLARAYALKNLLNPKTAHNLKRYGGRGDGSYVLSSDLLEMGNFVYSIGADAAFDLAMMFEGKIVFTDDRRDVSREFHNVIELLRPDSCDKFDMLASIIQNGHAGLDNLILKIDIEGGEYRFFNECPMGVMEQFSQIAVEIHRPLRRYEDDNLEEGWERRWSALVKLFSTHYLVHLHGNNYGGMIEGIPEVMECLFLRKNKTDADPLPLNLSAPHPNLDFPNDRNSPDLSFFWWAEQPSFADKDDMDT